MALEQCLEFLKQANYLNVIIEADSELVINSAKRISHGTGSEKVSKHWRLISVLHKIQGHLQGLRMVRFKHVHRKANKLVNILAKQGVSCKESRILMELLALPQGKLKELCHNQAEEDKEVYRNKTKEAKSQ